LTVAEFTLIRRSVRRLMLAAAALFTVNHSRRERTWSNICQGPYLTEMAHSLQCSGLRETFLISMRFNFHE
jgi:hypothetical protein